MLENESQNLPLIKKLRMFIRLWNGSIESLQEAPASTLILEDDLLIASLAEHLAQICKKPVPEWVFSMPKMEKPAFPGGSSIRALAESPVAFRRRMIFIS
ncbi:MAG TPA: hypothetical protein VIY47_09000, partial [Ignavibacteriaceae bacterium]